ncbi:MAG: hypothetical protein ACYCRE_03265 [Acidobacteriaceae bacterium]
MTERAPRNAAADNDTPGRSRDLHHPVRAQQLLWAIALAYVLKTGPDSAAALLRKVSGKRSIRGVSNGHLTEAICAAGVRTRLAFPIGNVPHPQLRRWLSIREDPAALYIVNITHHYIVVHGNHVFDSRFHLGKPLEKCPYLLRRVVNAWRVFRRQSSGTFFFPFPVCSIRMRWLL